MATSTFLSNATVNITQGVTTTDLSDPCRAVTDLRPGVLIIGGGQELPTYDLTVRVAVRRN